MCTIFLVCSSSRPGTSLNSHAVMKHQPLDETRSEESSSEEDDNSLAESSLSKLSSERVFSPDNPSELND